MKPLPTTFTKGSYPVLKAYWKQVERTGDVAIFEKTFEGGQEKSYEVVIVQKAPEYKIAGVVIAAHEHMPRDESWGEQGWTYVRLPDAETKYLELLDKA